MLCLEQPLLIIKNVSEPHNFRHKLLWISIKNKKIYFFLILFVFSKLKWNSLASASLSFPKSYLFVWGGGGGGRRGKTQSFSLPLRRTSPRCWNLLPQACVTWLQRSELSTEPAAAFWRFHVRNGPQTRFSSHLVPSLFSSLFVFYFLFVLLLHPHGGIMRTSDALGVWQTAV